MFPQLITALRQAGSDPTDDVIAEALWMFQYLPDPAPGADTEVGMVLPPGDAAAQLPPVEPPNHPKQALRPFPASIEPSASRSEPDGGAAEIYPKIDDALNKTEQLGGIVIQTPGAPALGDALAFARALRPLARRVPSRTSFVVDEQETARRLAEERIFVPFLRPAGARWLKLHLVFDSSTSMAIWRKAIEELRLLFLRLGIFRDVRLWSMHTQHAEGALRITPLLRSATHEHAHLDPRALVDPSGRTLVVVVSDCVAPAWRSGMVAQALEIWGTHGPVAILQMLPERLWHRSSLGRELEVRLYCSVAGAPNVRLKAELPSILLRGRRERPRGIYVPVIPLDPESFHEWAAMVSGMPDARVPGYLLSTAARPLRQPSAAESETSAFTSLGDRRVERFLEHTSPLGIKLAKLLAAAPVISLPIIRLIQGALLPLSGQSHVAEVFLGGLLRPIVPSDDTESVLYDFVGDAREHLLRLADQATSERVYVQIQSSLSSYIATHIRHDHRFQAVLATPDGIDGQLPIAAQTAFARATVAVLRDLGYRELADAISQAARRRRPVPGGAAPSADDAAKTPASAETADARPSNQAVDEIDNLPEGLREQAAEAQPPNHVSLEAMFDLARQLLEQNDLNQAIAAANHTLQYFPDNLEAYRILGEAYLANRQLDRAQELFERVLRSDPENVPAHVGLGITAERHGELDRAIAEFELALEIKPDMAELRSQLLRLYSESLGSESAQLRLSDVGLARLYAKGHMLPQAISQFRKVLANEPNRYDAAVALAETLWRDGQEDKAIELCRDILAEHPQSLKANLLLGYLLMSAGQPEGEQYWRAAQRLDPYQGVAGALFETLPITTESEPTLPAWDPDLRGQGDRDFGETSAGEAEKRATTTATIDSDTDDFLAGLLEQATEAQPPDRVPLEKRPEQATEAQPPNRVRLQDMLDRARELLDQDDMDGASAAAEHILQYFPDNLEAYRILGEAYLMKRRLDRAQAAFERVLRSDPENVPAHVGLAITYERLGQIDNAIVESERAMEIKSDIEELRKYLLRLYSDDLGRENIQLKLSRGGLARLYAKGQMLSQAIDEFRQVLADQPDRQDMVVALAETLWRDGQEDETIDLCRDILAERPESLKANLLLGYLLMGAGQPEGERYWRAAQRMDPYQMVAHTLFETLPITTEPEPTLPAWDESAWRRASRRSEAL